MICDVDERLVFAALWAKHGHVVNVFVCGLLFKHSRSHKRRDTVIKNGDRTEHRRARNERGESTVTSVRCFLKEDTLKRDIVDGWCLCLSMVVCEYADFLPISIARQHSHREKCAVMCRSMTEDISGAAWRWLIKIISPSYKYLHTYMNDTPRRYSDGTYLHRGWAIPIFRSLYVTRVCCMETL